MSNPLFNVLGGQPVSNDGFDQVMAQFKQFANSFKGSPTDKIQNMLNSGQMTQAQYNQLLPMARKMAALIAK